MLPLAAYFAFSLPLDEAPSDTEVDALVEVLGRLGRFCSPESCEPTETNSGLALLPLVELVRDVARLTSLEMVSCLDG